jgi:hypothetical protein
MPPSVLKDADVKDVKSMGFPDGSSNSTVVLRKNMTVRTGTTMLNKIESQTKAEYPPDKAS